METSLLKARPTLQSPRLLRAACAVCSSSQRPFSALNRPHPNYPGHVPLTRLERAGLAVGAGVMALFNPRRADLVAAVGEATATPYFIYRLRDAMLAHPTGRRILRERPRITSKSLPPLSTLRSMPESTLGRTYAAWADKEGVSPDTRDPVRYIDDEECAYVMQRYRECHDFYHALMGLPTYREGELALKAFEFTNTLLPMAGLSLFAVGTLKPDERRRFFNLYLPWAVRNGARSEEIINVYWEEELERDVNDIRQDLGIEQPPDLRAIRKKIRDEKRRQKESMQATGP